MWLELYTDDFQIIFKYISNIPCEITLMGMPKGVPNKKSILVQVILGDVRQQFVTWANVDLDQCRSMASPGHSELNV